MKYFLLLLLPFTALAEPPTLTPNGTYVYGTPTLAPDGSYVSGTPVLTSNGTYIGTPPTPTLNIYPEYRDYRERYQPKPKED